MTSCLQGMEFGHSSFLSRPGPGWALTRLLLMIRLVHLWPVSVFPPISCYLSLSQRCNIIACKCVVCGTQHNVDLFNPSSAVTLQSLDRNFLPHGKICNTGTQSFLLFSVLAFLLVRYKSMWMLLADIRRLLMHFKLMGGSHLCFLNVSLKLWAQHRLCAGRGAVN